MAKSKRQKDLAEARRAKDKTEHWLIVYNPWFTKHTRRSPILSDLDCQDIAWWLETIFGKVQGIQRKNNHHFVIAKVDLNVDIEPRLGQYDWIDFLKAATDYERRETSKIFEYHFIKYGDPSDKQWEEYYPLSRQPPHDFQVRRDPPAPLWCEHRNLGAAADWCMPLKRSPTAVFNSQDSRHNIDPSQSSASNEASSTARGDMSPSSDPRHRAPSSSNATPFALPVSSRPYIPIHLSHESSLPMCTTDPLTRPPLPLHAQQAAPVPPLTAFRPYETPAHHTSNPLTLVDDRDVKIKREPSPIRVHYDEDEMAKHEPSPIRVPYKGGEVPADPVPSSKVKPEVEHDTLGELTYPNSDPNEPQAEVALKTERGPMAKPELEQETHGLLAPESDQLSTQLVIIKNPFGVRWPPDDSLPDVLGVWDWLELFADGALAVYSSRIRAPASNEEQLIARLQSDVDLRGVLGRHEWRQILKECPSGMENEVSTVAPYLMDPETQFLDRIDAPESKENYEHFRAPYPPPLPLLKEEGKQDVKIKVEGTQKRHGDDQEDGSRKRVKLEAQD